MTSIDDVLDRLESGAHVTWRDAVFGLDQPFRGCALELASHIKDPNTFTDWPDGVQGSVAEFAWVINDALLFKYGTAKVGQRHRPANAAQARALIEFGLLVINSKSDLGSTNWVKLTREEEPSRTAGEIVERTFSFDEALAEAITWVQAVSKKDEEEE